MSISFKNRNTVLVIISMSPNAWEVVFKRKLHVINLISNGTLLLRIICLKIVIYEYLRKNMIKKSTILPYTHLNYHMFISM